MRSAALKIAINAQLKPDAPAGGVRRVVSGLIRALGELNDGHEEYVIIGSDRGTEWIEPLLGPNQSLVAAPGPDIHLGRRAALLGSLRLLAGNTSRSIGLAGLVLKSLLDRDCVPISNGFYESLGCDVIHFPYQQFIRTTLPAVFNPHDLQHRYFPENFTASARAWRESNFRAGFREARTVVVSSQWVRGDIVRHYATAPGRIEVIPWGTGTEFEAAPGPSALADVARRYTLPEVFAFYPAVAWPHKNHRRLVEAVAILRDRDGMRIHLVCTGANGSAMDEIRAAISRHAVEDQVSFLGTVPAEDMRSLYRLAQFVIIPTLFEASSGPVREAWLDGTAVACAAVTSLPEQLGDAGLLFDPYSVDDIADVMRRLSSDAALRDRLARRGREKLQDLRWERVARAYRSVYRRAAGVAMPGRHAATAVAAGRGRAATSGRQA